MGFSTRDGDTVCFIGDSITHNGLYHRVLADVCRLRQPGCRVGWVNCGISGDTAGGALARFDGDIAVHQPTRAFVLFGMNDGNRGLYDRRVAGTGGNAGARAGAIAAYGANLAALVARLRATGVSQIILLSPTAYDQYTRPGVGDEPCGYDDALAGMGAVTRDLAAREGTDFVELHAVFRAAVQADAAAGRPGFVREDRVHPGPAGHLLMAVAILDALGTPKGVTRTEIRADGSVTATNAEVGGVTVSVARVAWTCAARALPCVAPAEAWAAAPAALQAAWHALNREVLTVRGLAAGPHVLAVDGQVVMSADASEWERGVDLAALDRTPSVVQAAEVARLSEARHQYAITRIRNPVAARMFLGWDRFALGKQGVVVPEGESEGARYLVGRGEGNPYVLGLYRDLLEYGSETALKASAARLTELESAITQAAVIPVRRYELRRQATGAPEPAV